MTNIPGYQSLAQIYESVNSLVYRGIRERDNQAVILKVLKEDYPTPQELTRYKQEYEITRNLKLDSAVKAYGLEPYHRTLVIIFEDFGASSLKLLIDEQMRVGTRATPLQEFLSLAIQIARSLGAIHAANIIHKDINPSNIVLNPETEQLKIIDFGISTVLSRSTPTLKHPNVLEGTLAYISPEQTGRMNRYLDYRTDFYSLGVTFYELLTGQLPFATTDVLELVHCHIAKQPKSPRQVNPEIPQVVSDLIMKLMAKTAEERYQSAWGIIADLEECRRQLEATGTVEDFPLGTQDISDKFQIPQKLYGREAEVQTLLAAFERVASGVGAGLADSLSGKQTTYQQNPPSHNSSTPSPQSKTQNSGRYLKSEVSSDSRASKSKIEMMLVVGFSGIGKSALVQEIYKPITQRRGYFISGKFDQFQRNIPYSAVVSAFTGLVRQLLTESEAQLNQWREKLLAALSSNGQVIIDVIPEVELIVGKQPAVPELGATESQNRFNLVFQNFIRVFCSYQHPLVIFLDDLQWVCPATLKLIELMMTDTDMQYLFLIGAYRDNQVNSAHPLIMTIEGLRKQGATINQITLAPLALNHITHLIAETLHSDTKSVKSLASLIVRKTGGNPFFVNEFLKTLYAENLLTFTPSGEIGRWRNQEIVTSPPNWGLWQWDIVQIEAQDITDNVVELMIGKLKKLPNSTQHILQLAACVGADFDLNTLSIICKKSSSEIFSDLILAVHLGLILPISELDTQLLIQDYKFGHDRIQQAAYALIDEAQKKVVHLQIGRLLLQNTVPEALSEKLFEIVDHLNVGVGAGTGALFLLTHQAERDEIAKLNLMAGQKALAATAYEAALQYFNAGRELLSVDSWQNSYDLTLALYDAVAEAAYLIGDFEQMEQLVEAVLNHAKTVLDQVKVYEVKIQAAGAQGNLKKAIEIGLQMLKLLGVVLPEEPSHFDTQRGLEETSSLLVGKEIEDLINLPEMIEPEKLAVLSILSGITAFSYIAAPTLFPLLVCQQLNLSIRYGNATWSTFAYATYGLILCGIVQDIETSYKFGQLAFNLMERLNALKFKAKLSGEVGGGINIWKTHIKETVPILIEGYQSGVETGDFEFASYCAFYVCEHLYFSSHELTNLEQEIATFNKSISQLKQKTPFNWTAIFWQATLNLLSRGDNPLKLIGESYNEERSLPCAIAANDRTGLHLIYLNKLILSYLFGEEHQAAKNAILAEQYLDSVVGALAVALFQFYDSLAHLGVFASSSNSEKEALLNRVSSNQEKMRKWANHAPMNYLHKFYLVEAEEARVLGQIVEAMDFYERAIKGAKENGFIQEEALAYELAAKFYLARNMEKIAQTYIKEAHYTYTHWGATAKVKNLESRYPQFFAKRSPKSVKITQTISDTSEQTSTNLDLLSIVKASQTLSGELVLDTLLEKIMKLVIENAGAETGYLILNKSGQWAIEAAVTIESDDIKVLQSIPIETVSNSSVTPSVPLGLVNYVMHTQESIVLNDAAHEGNFISDSYIIKQQPKSVLCAPLLNQSKLVGILYLENNLTTEAFTPDRLQLLNLLSSQAAISIENAKLYADVRETEAQLTQSLEDLRKSETRFRLAVDNFPDGTFVIYDAHRRFQFVNTHGVKLGGLPESSLLGHTDEEIHPPEITDAYLPCLQKAVETRTSQSKECTINLPTIGQITFVVTYVPLLDERGEIYQILGITHDITLRKQSERQIQESLREKEVLLQEIHHRVKNNLQVISSLLDLQSQQLNEPTLLEMFRDSRNRVKSMALVHEKLYESKTFARVNFSEYIETLAMSLFLIYGIDTNQISLELKLDEVVLSIDTAIPCGLIINELISNTLKYAFPNLTEGTIYIALNCEEGHYYTLIVRDNGIGLPENFNFNTVESLGLKLVKILANQIEGTLKVDCRFGTEFHLRFSETSS